MGATELAELQRHVARIIRQPVPLDGADAATEREIARMVRPGPRMTAVDRLEVYREQFWLRHRANLAEDFPTLSAFAGGGVAFERLATGYLSSFAPCTWDLQRLGRSMPEYVTSASPWRDDPLLGDAALLDWAHVQAFDAADVPPLDVQSVAAAPEDALLRATVRFHPSLTLLSLGHPVHLSRATVMAGGCPDRLERTPVFLGVWRDARCIVQQQEVQQAAFLLGTALAAGFLLGEACDRLARELRDLPPPAIQSCVESSFRDWTARGWVATVELPAS